MASLGSYAGALLGSDCDTSISLCRFVSDRETWNIDRQFLLGPAFLVSPVLEAVSMETRGSKDSM